MSPLPHWECVEDEDWHVPKHLPHDLPHDHLAYSKTYHDSFFNLTSKKMTFEQLGFKESLLLRLKILRRDIELGKYGSNARGSASELYDIEQFIQKELWF